LRLKILIYIFTAIWLIILFRLYNISIRNHEYYNEIAKNNAIKEEKIAPLRGFIFDRNGVPLAINKLGFSIAIASHLKSGETEKLNKVVDEIISYFPNEDKAKIIKKYKKLNSPYNHSYIRVINFIDYDKILPLYQNSHLTNLSKSYPPQKDTIIMKPWQVM